MENAATPCQQREKHMVPTCPLRLSPKQLHMTEDATKNTEVCIRTSGRESKIHPCVLGHVDRLTGCLHLGTLHAW
jgi:hypothetical protein